jgi:hypothetical protein
MYLPRTFYEALPWLYVVGGLVLAALSWHRRESGWSDVALVTGVGAFVGGIVLLMRRRTYRDDAARYDPRSLDDA